MAGARTITVRFADDDEFAAVEIHRGPLAREPYVRKALRFYREHVPPIGDDALSQPEVPRGPRSSAEAKRGVVPLAKGAEHG